MPPPPVVKAPRVVVSKPATRPTTAAPAAAGADSDCNAQNEEDAVDCSGRKTPALARAGNGDGQRFGGTFEREID